MRIGLVGSAPSKQHSGSFDLLSAALRARGHDIERIDVPVPGESVDAILDAHQHCLDLDTSDFDVVISTSAPGWMVTHHHHVVYTEADGPGFDSTAIPDVDVSDLDRTETPTDLIRVARQVLRHETETRPMSAGGLTTWLRQRLARSALVHRPPVLVASVSEFAASKVAALGVDQPIMVAPPPPGIDAPDTLRVPPRMVVFAESTFDRADRIEMLMAAFSATTAAHAELRIAGDGPLRAGLEESTHDRRIHFLGEIESADRQRELLGASSVVIVSVETGWSSVGCDAMSVGTPLVAACDAGGVTEMVEHGVNGVIVEPTVEEFGWGMRHVASSPQLRWQLGLQAKRRSMALDWGPFLGALDDIATDVARPSVLTLSTYPIDPMVGGGQRRARFLSRSMAAVCNVTVLVNTSPTDRIRRRLIEPGLVQIEMPKSEAQLEAELDIFHAMGGLPVDDITAADLTKATPAFNHELRERLDDADLIVATQPFLVPCLPPTDTPIVHDSQNVESILKADLLPDTVSGRWLLERVERAEELAGERASVVTACTTADLERLTTARGLSVPGVCVGNGVDTKALPRKTADEHRAARRELLALAGVPVGDDRPIGLFIGSWHPPNIEAARLIVDLAAMRSDWLFVLAGSHTSEFADETLPANVHTIAVFAESLLWPLLAGADVALNPMRSGGGSNLKLFDYLSVGTSIVTTTTGARGLDEPERVATIAEGDVLAFSAAIDRCLREQSLPVGHERIDAGRELVESMFDWELLGEQWRVGILSAVGLQPGPPRQRSTSTLRPLASPVDPPSTDPVMATMQLLGLQARSIPPTPQGAAMDPLLRERIKRAKDNRNIGRELPSGARFTAPKKALIRVGQALTNEQVIYNEAIVDAVEQLAVTLREIESEQRELRKVIDAVSADNDALRRRLEHLEGNG